MWIKICANTNLEDALLAAELGADAVGFVFAPSKRQVTAEQVATITPRLPASVERVGVFTTQHEPSEIAEAVRIAGLNTVQLHGGVNLRVVDKLAPLLPAGAGIIQTIEWTVSGDIVAAYEHVVDELSIAALSSESDRVLVDSKVAGASGGTGVPFDWVAGRLALKAQAAVRIIVAGGLTPENVDVAIRRLAPWGVDVASGVESVPGRKDPERLRRFIQTARAAGERG